MSDRHDDDAGRDARQAARIARKKAMVDAHIAAAQQERGVLLVNTGNGKGESSAAFGLVVLDELNIVLKYGYLDVDTVLADLAARPVCQHVVMTGRAAPAGLVAAATR